MLREEKGSVTIYLAVIFLALLILLGLFVDLARIKVAQNQLRRVTNSAARSVLADYNTTLRTRYGLYGANEANYDLAFRKYLFANLSGSSQGSQTFACRLENSSLQAGRPLKVVLKQQILEEMKYKAPITITKDIINKFKQVEEISANYSKQVKQGKQLSSQSKTSGNATSGGTATGSKTTVGKTTGGKATGSKKTSGKPSENTTIEYPEEESLLRQIREYTRKSSDKVGNDKTSLSRDKLDVGKADANAVQLEHLFKLASPQESLITMRDELFVNEYVLTRFPNYSMGRANLMDGEYVLCGGTPGTNLKPQVIARLYPLRMALDTMAYLAFSKAPVDPLARLIYSLGMGALQATLDVYRLLDGKTVTIAAMQPGNPLDKTKGLQMNYREHLRVLLLLDSGKEQEKLDRIIRLIQFRNSVDATQVNTLVQGQATVSIKLWFLPLGGMGNLPQGPFGTRIRGGRCYISKAVEYGY